MRSIQEHIERVCPNTLGRMMDTGIDMGSHVASRVVNDLMFPVGDSTSYLVSHQDEPSSSFRRPMVNIGDKIQGVCTPWVTRAVPKSALLFDLWKPLAFAITGVWQFTHFPEFFRDDHEARRLRDQR